MRVDIDPEVLCDRHAADYVILADCFAVLDQLSDLLDAPLGTDWAAAEVTSARAK